LDGRSIVIVTLFPEFIEMAQEIAYSILPYHVSDFSKTRQEEIHRSIIGHVGQLAFLYYLDPTSWREQAAAIPIGTYDNGDFQYRGFYGDVKSSDTRFPPKLLITETDFLARQYDIYVDVWIRLDLNQAWILGWAWKEEVARAFVDRKMRKPAYAIPFKELREPKEALKLPFNLEGASNPAESASAEIDSLDNRQKGTSV